MSNVGSVRKMVVRLARRFQRALLLRVFNSAVRRRIYGLSVGVAKGTLGSESAFQRIGAGLALLAEHRPSTIAHLRRDALGILIWDRRAAAGVGSWHYGVKLLMVEASFLCNRETTPAHVATLLVHEATHARLCRFGYAPENRHRVEAICFRRERAFVRKLPHSRELLEEIEAQLQRDPSYWTQNAHAHRVVEELATASMFRWLVRVVQHLSGGRGSTK